MLTGFGGVVERIWLDVPYSQKDQAKAAGARWDGQAGRWYAPRPGMAALGPWAALAPVPLLLPGEDRTFGSGLFVDLVPRGCWFTNARSCIDERDWERIRRMVLARAQQRCEACGQGMDRQARRWLEVHERWAYDTHTRVQTLRRLICLCSNCHGATHFGLAQVKGTDPQARAHLATVTGMSRPALEAHIREAFTAWEARNKVIWSLDLGILSDAGVRLAAPPNAKDRASLADQALHRAQQENTGLRVRQAADEGA